MISKEEYLKERMLIREIEIIAKDMKFLRREKRNESIIENILLKNKRWKVGATNTYEKNKHMHWEKSRVGGQRTKPSISM